MMKGWKEYSLGDVAFYINEKIDAKFLNKANYISSDNMLPEKGEITLSDYLPKSGKVSKYAPKDILVSNIRPYFKKIWYAKKIGGCSNDVIVFRAKSDLIDSTFLYYNISRNEFFDFMMAGANGTKMPRGNKKAIPTFKINLPPLPTQRKISKILSAYDDLIENNLKRIKLLEEMAQNEFNEWYSNNNDFEEVNLGSIIGHEIGGGWGAEEQSEEFSEPAYVIRGTDIDELPKGKIEKVPFRYHKKSNLSSRKLQDGDIIFEVSGGSSYEGVAKTLLITDELLKQFDNDVMPASFCKLARPIERKYSSFLFLFWRFLRKIKGTEVFEIRSASNIVNYNWTAFLKFQKINKPSETELKKLNNKVEPIHKHIYNLGNKNQRLREARDILLPRLMTGMIDVDKIKLNF